MEYYKNGAWNYIHKCHWVGGTKSALYVACYSSEGDVTTMFYKSKVSQRWPSASLCHTSLDLDPTRIQTNDTQKRLMINRWMCAHSSYSLLIASTNKMSAHVKDVASLLHLHMSVHTTAIYTVTAPIHQCTRQQCVIYGVTTIYYSNTTTSIHQCTRQQCVVFNIYFTLTMILCLLQSVPHFDPSLRTCRVFHPSPPPSPTQYTEWVTLWL